MSHHDESGPLMELTGFAAASPIGFMAALGLLRVCAEDHGQPVRLSWVGGHARLHGLDRKTLLELLGQHLRGRSRAPEFNFEVRDEKGKRGPVMHLRQIPAEDYRAAARALAGDRRALGFLAGYGTDAVVNEHGYIARNRLDFTSGQQRLMEEIRLLAALLDPDAKRHRVPWSTRVGRSLFGGPYEEQHTFGWDPASLMTHAHQRAAPTDSATPGQPLTVWLAVEALPLHPVLARAAGRAQTSGFERGSAYVWPEWSAPLGLNEVRLLRQRPVDTLNLLPGVDAIWVSRVTSVGKYGFLLPAARTRSVGPGPDTFARELSLDESTG